MVVPNSAAGVCTVGKCIALHYWKASGCQVDDLEEAGVVINRDRMRGRINGSRKVNCDDRAARRQMMSLVHS